MSKVIILSEYDTNHSTISLKEKSHAKRKLIDIDVVFRLLNLKP